MLKPKRELLQGIQSKLARTTASASALRGSTHGTAAVVREFLADVDLRTFRTSDVRVFDRRLDSHTRRLAAVTPGPPKATWGVARKMMNLFLRECAYNAYLRSAYGLGRSEPLLELPLDAYTGKAVLKASGRRESEWPGIRRLTPAESSVLQSAALVVASARRLRRVHLDVIYWATDRE